MQDALIVKKQRIELVIEHKFLNWMAVSVADFCDGARYVPAVDQQDAYPPNAIAMKPLRSGFPDLTDSSLSPNLMHLNAPRRAERGIKYFMTCADSGARDIVRDDVLTDRRKPAVNTAVERIEFQRLDVRLMRLLNDAACRDSRHREATAPVPATIRHIRIWD